MRKKIIGKDLKKPKKPIKGVRYIAQRLRKYQKRKYPTYKIALNEASNVLSKLKSKNKNVTLKNIFEITKSKSKIKKAKEKAPYIPEFMLEPNPYFSLLDYDYWIKRCSKNVFFESTVSPSTMEDIQGGTKIDVEEYFLDFVRYCNTLKSQTDAEEDRYLSEWQVICTKPQKINGRWVSTILCVNEEGDQTNYGFNPDKPTAEPPPPMPIKGIKQIQKQKNKKEELAKKQKKEEKGKADAERVAELNKMIDRLERQYEKGLLTKKDFSKKVDIILSKLEKGGNI